MARQWSVAGRAYPEYDEFGEIVSTTITLASQNDGYATFTETIAGDYTRKSNDELIKLARDQYFKKEYADYAMQDAVIKVDELERSIKKSEILQTSLQELITNTQEQAVKNAEDLQAAENRRNAVFGQIVGTINEYEQRFATLAVTMNGLMDEVFAMLSPEEALNDTEAEGSTPESHADTAGENSGGDENAANDDPSL